MPGTFTSTNPSLLVISLAMEDANERLNITNMQGTCGCYYDYDLSENIYCEHCLVDYRLLDDLALVLVQVEQICGIELDWQWVIELDGDQPF